MKRVRYVENLSLSKRSALFNRNVLAFLLASPFNSIAFGLSWFTSTFMIYAFADADKNTQLGRVGGIVALVTLISSIAGAYISDHYRRDIMIYISYLITLFSFYQYTRADSVADVLFAQSIMSLSWGIGGPSQNALIADSTPPNLRNWVYGWIFAVSNVFLAGGNIVGYFLFNKYGEDPNPEVLRLAMKVSLALTLIGGVFYLMINDKHVLPAEKDMVLGEQEDEKALAGFTKSGLYAVGVMLFSGLLIGFGAGVSIPFLQYFFYEQYKIKLDDLSLIFALMMILTGFLGKWLADLGTKHGRVRMIVISQGIAVVLLYALATYPPLFIAIIALLARNASMNAVGPLSQALLMDNTPRVRRSIIGLLSNIGWSLFFGFGQFLGGMLIDQYGYWVAFLITATLYLIATILIGTIREHQSNNGVNPNTEFASDELIESVQQSA